MNLLLSLITGTVVSATSYHEKEFNREIRPIFARNCGACHNASMPGANWTEYADAVAKRDKIYFRMFVTRDMPSILKKITPAELTRLQQWLK